MSALVVVTRIRVILIRARMDGKRVKGHAGLIEWLNEHTQYRNGSGCCTVGRGMVNDKFTVCIVVF